MLTTTLSINNQIPLPTSLITSPFSYRRILKELRHYQMNTGKTVFDLETFNNYYLITTYINNCKISIIYNNNYPFKPPKKILIDNCDIFYIYKKIMTQNKDRINSEDCICCKSNLCGDNWHPAKKLNDIIKEVNFLVKYKDFYINKILLNKIIHKYSIQDMSYLLEYLLLFKELDN